MRVHELKTFDPYFDAVERGEKTFEVRYNDRDYQKGDILRLICIKGPGSQPYALDAQGERRCIDRLVTYVLEGGQFGIEPDYVVLGIKELKT